MISSDNSSFFYVLFVSPHRRMQMMSPARTAIKVASAVGNKIGKMTGSTAAPMLLTEMYKLAAIPTFASVTPFSVS